MRVTNNVSDMQYAMQRSQQALSSALEQVSTGLRVNRLSDDPGASSNMVRSLAASANVDQYTSNVNSLQAQLQSADSAISNIVSSLNSAVTLGTSGANGTNSASSRQIIATQVEGLLSSVIAQANTTLQGVYLFGGSANSTPPFVAASSTFTSSAGSATNPLAPSTALTAGSITTIGDASTGQTMVYKAAAGATLATLTSAIASAVGDGTLSPGTTASINAAGQLSIATNSSSAGIAVTSNDSALGTMTATPGTDVANAYAYVGNSGINQVQVGDSMVVSTNLPGNQLLTSGPNVIGTLSSLISTLKSGTTEQIAAAAGAVTSALNYVSQQRAPLGNTLNQLNSQETFLGQETVTLKSQQSSLVGIDLATAATNLSQAELDHSAVLAAAAKVLPQTLLDYLK
jgi:flagellar hook-associated protein 3 FlgL